MADTTAPAAAESAAPAKPATASAVLGTANTAPAEGIGEAPQRGTPAYGRWVMADALLKQGALTAEQAREQLAASETANNADDSAADGARPNELTLAAEAVQASTEAHGALQSLHELPLDAPTATFYSRALDRAMRNPPSDAQKAQQATTTLRDFDSMYGKDGAAKMLADAQAEVSYMEATDVPRIREWLEKTGGGNDPFLIKQLATRYGERMNARAAKGLKR